MFCSHCGQSNPDGSVFCTSCGVAQATQVNPAPTVTPVSNYVEVPVAAKNKFLSPKWLISAGSALVLIVGLVVVFLPKSVDVEIGVIAPNGGVFDSACNVQSDAEDQTPMTIDFSKSEDNTSPTNVPVVYSMNASGACVGKVRVSLSPFTTYYAFNGEYKLAELSASDISSGKISIGTSVTVTRDLRVNFNLYDQADRCTGSTESWNCWWNNDYVFGLKLNSNKGTCSGQNGFSDIHKGTNVTVEGRSNHQIATGTLVVDTYELVSVKSKQIVCKFKVDFTGIANDDLGYAITTSHRGTVDFDLDQIRENSWTADLQLNQ